MFSCCVNSRGGVIIIAASARRSRRWPTVDLQKHEDQTKEDHQKTFGPHGSNVLSAATKSNVYVLKQNPEGYHADLKNGGLSSIVLRTQNVVFLVLSFNLY